MCIYVCECIYVYVYIYLSLMLCFFKEENIACECQAGPWVLLTLASLCS